MSSPIEDSSWADSRWGQAYLKIRAFQATGAADEEVDVFTALLEKECPPPETSEEHAQYALVQAQAIRDAQEAKAR
jgi:hypothetical protein